jgi:hypothetical protein
VGARHSIQLQRIDEAIVNLLALRYLVWIQSSLLECDQACIGIGIVEELLDCYGRHGNLCGLIRFVLLWSRSTGEIPVITALSGHDSLSGVPLIQYGTKRTNIQFTEVVPAAEELPVSSFHLL